MSARDLFVYCIVGISVEQFRPTLLRNHTVSREEFYIVLLDEAVCTRHARKVRGETRLKAAITSTG